jgi:hypothetical protein
MPEGSKLWNIVSEVFCIFYAFFRIRSQTYITTNHAELAQGVAMNISNGYGYGEGE